MKKSLYLIISLTIIGAIITGYNVFAASKKYLGAFSDPFISLQVGTDPSNNDVLTTDGTNSSWVDINTLVSAFNHWFTNANGQLTVTTTVGIYTDGYASTTGGLFTQGNAWIGGSATSTELHITGNATSTFGGDISLLSNHSIIEAHAFVADETDGLRLENHARGLVALLGAGNGLGTTFYDGVNVTGVLSVSSYASSTLGLFTQDSGHFGGNLTVDGNATSTHFAASEICLSNDCKTAWPVGGGGGGAAWEKYTGLSSPADIITPTTTNASIYVSGNATTTGNLEVMGTASTTGEIFATGGVSIGISTLGSNGGIGIKSQLYTGANTGLRIYHNAASTNDYGYVFESNGSNLLTINNSGNATFTGYATTTGGLYTMADVYSGGSLTVGANQQMKIGSWVGGATSYAAIANSTIFANSSDYAMIHHSNGTLFLNAKAGTSLNLRVGNSSSDITWNGTVFDIVGALTVSGNATTTAQLIIDSAQNTDGNLKFSAANPYIKASSYITIPGGAFFNTNIVYFAAEAKFRNGLANDTTTNYNGDLVVNDSFRVTGNATTSGWLNIGTTAVGTVLGANIGAGDLYASGNVTSTLSLWVGGASGFMIESSGAIKRQVGIPDMINFQIQQGKVGHFTTSPSPAQQDGAQKRWYGLFDASTDECMDFQTIMPYTYSSTNMTLNAQITFSMASATTGNVIDYIQVMATTGGDSADIETDSFATANTTATTAVAGTAGYMKSIITTLSNTDSLTAGDLVTFRVCRDADNGSDTATGDQEISGFTVYWN